ncbi:MAG TPA: SPFH domain-containing protein [Xanthobacteraceae bacterium]|jgi:regulator of protease activity HflC (stomatin/prohibitin superfamily)|nr:SPFH domain-containing protein [Xanthobacteraceae bacterium]
MLAKYPESIDDLPPPRRKRGLWGFFVRHLPGLSVMVMMGLLIVVVLWPYIVITVPSGRVGVLWKRFNGIDIYCWCWVGRGTVLDPRELRDEGLHITWPWDKLFLYDLRLQSNQQTYNAISKDGVNVKAQISTRYQLLHNSTAVLHKFIGPDYLTSVVSPEIGSQAREVLSEYTAEEVYTSRDAIQKQIRDNAQKSLAANLNKLVQPEAMEQPDPKHYNEFLQDSIQILDTLVLSIELPPDIVAAINRQTEQYYMIQEFKFRVQREAEESKRKQIEADGIAAFQKTVSQGISDSYLRWRGIEATLALAQSQNAKIVVIGTGKDGLPIILGNVDTPATPGVAGTPNPANGAPPDSSSPSDGTPASAPTPTAPGGTPPNAPANGKSGSAAPNAPASDAASSTTKETGNVAQSAGPIDLPGVRSVLSNISGALRAGADLTSPAPPPPAKKQ